MAISIITKEDLQEFKTELLESIEKLLQGNTSEQKLWLRTSEVKELLHVSSGTLQNMRINGTLSYSKVGGMLYYNYKDIQKLMMDFKRSPIINTHGKDER
ncbi:helix-turn-helix domain-containing protein [Chryseobacterium polytrichastri]|uniref:Helix-turn-helix domain-containing protein n=1 Tax=Chryseobacterium polytrichastri TaxID=1302687 RepID=A0A1M6VVG8_9FLAO|nr:helix-turn-helix domain-containing protein [Chryseobacterium polytrichastri]SHK85355.1 Helix-turn-helix domain-containing protein [Chryseobacterium polytrichastri]